MGSAAKTNIGRATREGGTADDLAVEVARAYLNQAEGVRQLRAALDMGAVTDILSDGSAD